MRNIDELDIDKGDSSGHPDFTYLFVVLLVALLVWSVWSLPNSTKLIEGEWVCTKAAPNGLAMQCNEYQRVVK